MSLMVQPITINDKTIVLLHFDPITVRLASGVLDRIAHNIESLTGVEVIIVPFGQPTPGYPAIYLVEEDEVSASLIKKLARNAKPGAIIPLTPTEMECFRKNVEIIS